jgi:hypothetical protein
MALRHIQMQRQELEPKSSIRAELPLGEVSLSTVCLLCRTAKFLCGGIGSIIGSLFPFETLIERKAAETPTSDGW